MLMTRVYAYGLTAVLLIGIGFGLGRLSVRDTTLQITVSHPSNIETVVEIPVPVLTEKVITQYVSASDAPMVKKIMQENAARDSQVRELGITVAQHTTMGEGPLTTVAPDALPSAPSDEAPDVSYKDWRLEFTGRGNQGRYTLKQTFSIVNTIGTDNAGKPTRITQLYEHWPNDERKEVPITESTVFRTPDKPKKWFVSPRINAGIAQTRDVSSSSPHTTFVPTGVVALSWLKHGRSRANEDIRWTVLAPAVTITDTDKSVGVIPVAYNIGSLPKQPFTNIWIGPYIGTSTPLAPQQGFNRVGMTLTATF